MSVQSPNFGFLAAHDELLVKYAVRAERYVFEDPNTTLVKVRQFAETLAELAAAHSGIRVEPGDSQLALLRTLADRGILDPRIAEFFHLVRRVGNDAVHEHADDPGQALHMLKVARILAVWFHRTFGADRDFHAGPFVPPPRPEHASEALRNELDALNDALAEARRQVDAALESSQDAERRRKAAESRGNAIAHLSITDFANLPLPLPPLAEQKAICTATAQLLVGVFTDSTGENGAVGRIAALERAALAKAFRGELVP